VKHSKKLVSRNIHESTAKNEHSINVEIAPLNRGDLVVTSKSDNITGSAEILLVNKMSSSLHLINPSTLNHAEVNAGKYFAKPLLPLLTLRHLVPFVVLDITPIMPHLLPASAQKRMAFNEGMSMATMRGIDGVLAEAEVCRECDLGENDTTYTVVTHLGHILQAGDVALGYDLSHTVVDESLLENLPYDRPDVILVRKSYPEKQKKSKKGGGSYGRRRKAKAVQKAETESDGHGHDSVAGGSGGEVGVMGSDKLTSEVGSASTASGGVEGGVDIPSVNADIEHVHLELDGKIDGDDGDNGEIGDDDGTEDSVGGDGGYDEADVLDGSDGGGGKEGSGESFEGFLTGAVDETEFADFYAEQADDAGMAEQLRKLSLQRKQKRLQSTQTHTETRTSSEK
jgi:hypothetical protein